MPSHDYRFLTHWRVTGTLDEVFRIIDTPADYVRWWPAVWLRVETLDAGDAQGVGSVYRVTSKGWLPYLLCWTARTLAKEFPHRIEIEARGDFDGHGCWTFRPDGPDVLLEYRWEIAANKPLLRRLSFLLRPIFAANHNWAMARGEESLWLELARRHAPTDADRARLPRPPRPTFFGPRRQRRLGPVSTTRSTDPPSA